MIKSIFDIPYMKLCSNIFFYRYQKISNLRKYFILFLQFTFLLFPTQSFAQKIEIFGNKRIETNTILIHFKKENYSKKELNQVLKELYKTDLFSDIKIIIKNGKIKVKVTENPIINKIEIVGNKKLSNEVLTQEMSLVERSVYTKSKFINDIARINEIYKRSGRIHAKVIPKVRFLDNNRLDLVIKIDEKSKTRVHKITFHNNNKVSNRKLKKVIATKEKRWYRGSTSFFDPDRISFDKQLLRRFYLNKGYATFNVYDSKVEFIPEINGFIANYFLKEGAIYNFSKVLFESQYSNIKLESLEEFLHIKEGQKFSLSAIEQSIDNILNHLNDKGFAFADIEYDINTDDNSNTATIKITIKKNKRIYIRNIKVIGNSRTEDKVIRREIRLLEGDPYNNTRLKRSKQRLTNLGFFSNVKIKKVPVPNKDLIDIVLEVEEKPTGELNFGLGYSTTEKFLGNVSIKERNLMGKAHSVSLSAQKSSISDDIDLSYTIPNFMDREFSLGVDLFNLNTEYSESLSEIHTQGAGANIHYELTEYLSQTIGYSWKIDDVTNIDSSASIFIQEQEGRTSYSAISQGLYYDKRDNKINPSKGYYVKFSSALAGVGGDTKFLKAELGGVKYFPLWKNSVIFKSLLKGGMVEAYDSSTVKINHRFFLGGSSLRGFRNAGIGPRDNTEAALGGKYFYKGTAELLFPIGLPEELGFRGSIFSDFGGLTGLDNKSVDILDEDSIRISYGLGISWDSPLGPIRFDFAKTLKKESFDKTERFRINFGVRF